ncbi:MAG: hypothetical protein ACI9M9_002439 [Flavobacteriaceae bacterium]|jgi:hypothetical protein
MKKKIYAIIATNHNPKKIKDLTDTIKGIMGSDLYILSVNDIAIVASDIPSAEQISEKELALDFSRVIEELSQHVTLLPVRFGTFIKSNEIINQLLINHYDSFLTNLQKVENKCEFGLKVLYNCNKFSAIKKLKIVAEEDELSKYFSTNTIHTNYLFEKIKKNKQEDTLSKYVEQLIEDIGQHLTQINPDSKFKKIITNKILIDAVFLVKKNKKDEFIQAICAFNEQHDDLQFLLTGPWPPYSFVDIVIK